jgi:Tfp pilus assembly protein PilF
VAACEESIRRAQQLGDDRQVAVSKGQIGTIYTNQGLYAEALQAHAEARELFMQLNEPGSVAADWHDTGILYEAAEEPDLAEDAYRNSLSMRVQLGDVAGQGATLNQLGNLYLNILGRFEEAVNFYQDAVRTAVESGDILGEARGRNNLANTLSRLRRFDEARQEILRAIECESQFGHAAEPWTTWANLAQIELDADNHAASVDPKRQAVACYLAYRRDGGENRYQEGRLSLEVTEYLLAGDDAAATSRLEELTADPDLPSDARAFIDALQAIVGGGRDASLADAPDMGYLMAAEILFLLERLENLPSPKKQKKQKKHKKNKLCASS